MLEGVRNSAGMDENTGTRFGGFGDFAAVASTSRMVSMDGCTPSCRVIVSALIFDTDYESHIEHT